MQKNKFHKIRLFNNITNQQVGIFEYKNIPRVGEWLLTPDNNGGGDNIWIVEMVVHFPKYDELDVTNLDKDFVAIHASQANTSFEISLLRRQAFKNWEKKQIKVVSK